jgi:seryl-tRNA synthetase
MIDPKLLRSDPEAVARNLARRGFKLDLAALAALEERRKHWQVESDRLRAERNAHAKQVGMAKGRGEDIAPLMSRGEVLNGEVAKIEAELSQIQGQLDELQLGLPNLLHESVPEGRDESANVEVRRWGTPRSFSFRPRDHVELGEQLKGLDFEAAGRISRSRACSVHSRSSCWTCTRHSMATLRCMCPTWWQHQRCRAPASCRSSKRTCSSCAASRATT